MAVDTKAKRFAMLNFSSGALLPVSDGSIDAADRAHFLELYGGIALAEPAIIAVVVGAPGRKAERKPLPTTTGPMECLPMWQ